jgi:hypothetical protein
MIKQHPIYKTIATDEQGNIYSSFKKGTNKVTDNWYKRSQYKDRWGRYTKTFKLNGKIICRKVHRLVWECFNGVIPNKLEIDHIDRNPSNNNLSNLRLVNSYENKLNTGKKQYRNAKASSKYKGVCYVKMYGKWMASIKVNDKQRFLGYYKNEIDAGKSYDEVASRHGHLTNRELGLYEQLISN